MKPIVAIALRLLNAAARTALAVAALGVLGIGLLFSLWFFKGAEPAMQIFLGFLLCFIMERAWAASRRASGYVPRGAFQRRDLIRHVKSGKEYRIVATPDGGLRMEKGNEPAYCYTDPCEDSPEPLWVRSAREMEDGRFVLVARSISNPAAN